jgi:hypothetical protein
MGMGAAMAQEGPYDTQRGAAYFPTRAPAVQVPATHNSVQSGSSDVDMHPASGMWHPGNSYNNEGGQG